jgi:hypothetical protein
VLQQLVITTAPPGSITAGNPFGLVVTAEDGAGNVDTSFNGPITVSDDSGNPLGGTATVSAVNGVASFSGLTIEQAELTTLSATGKGLAGTTTAPLNVTAASASQLAVITPAGPILTGGKFTVSVQAVDPFGNVDLTFKGQVTLALGNNPTGAILGGTLTATAARGVATFILRSLTANASSGRRLMSSSGPSGPPSPSMSCRIAFVSLTSAVLRGGCGLR